MVSLIKEIVKQSILWTPFLCSLLHFNELPFKKLVTHHDGSTKGPKTSGGPIGKEISHLRDGGPMPKIVNFKPIPVPFIQVDKELLVNQDQKFLYEIFQLIRNGPQYLSKMDPNFEAKVPGELSLARWLTTAVSIGRVYVSTLNPSNALYRLVHIIMTIYAPMFFTIKKEYHVQNGAKHFCKEVSLARNNLDAKEWPKALKVFKRNCYHATPEAILLAGATDPAHYIEAINLIIKARKGQAAKRGQKEVRQLDMKDFRNIINFKTDNYFEMIDFKKLKPSLLTPPPLLSKYSDEFLLQVACGTRSLDSLEIPPIPCHAQDVERAVADTTRASKYRIGEENRHQYLLNSAKSRSQIGTNPKKSAFFNLKPNQ